jgi:tRNA (mo5U34)-methyltransferase
MHASPRLETNNHNVPVQPIAEITIKRTPFDQKEYRALIEAREQTLRRIVKKLKPTLGLSNAVDAGCGVGFFSRTLAECGLNVCGFDAREENIEEACRRFPGIPFERGNIEDRAIAQLGQFDLVLCFGLLYHLENPLQAIRNLRAITEKCLLLESMCLPEEKCTLPLRQEPPQDDQSLTEIACYPGEGSLVKMLYRAGFAKVYLTLLPNHDDFRETREHAQRRTILLASLVPIDVSGFRLFLEPQETEDPWAKKCRRECDPAAAHWAIPGQPHAQEIHQAGKPRSTDFSPYAHSLAASLRRVVARRRERTGPGTPLQRI